MGSPRRERARERARRGALTIFLSNPRARGKQPPGRRLFCFADFFLRPAPAGGGGVAAQLWGRVGAGGLARARVGSGRCPRSPTSRAREPPGRPATHQAGHITVLSSKIRLRRPSSLTLRARGFSFTTRQGERLVTALYYHENFRFSLLVGRRGFEIRPGVKSNDRAE